jgi:LysM repeat protein
MSSIRPLVTITILVIAAVFLYTKINQGPEQVPPGATDSIPSPPSDGIPPLAATAPNDTTNNTFPTAPAWADSTAATEPAAPQWAGSVTDAAANGADAMASADGTTATGVPPIPELPPLADAPPAAEPTAAVEPIEPPANIPIARYSSEAPAEESTTPPTASPFNTAASAHATIPTAEAVSPDAERFGSTAADPAQAASSLASSWPAIQSALERQELAQAHQMLSEWYGSPALSPLEAQQIEKLLSQLAGTVVYSTEHRLEPPYVVHAGDTLETIAAQYEVPWQLLAKINGIPASDLVQPGQELKVIHGPFSAVVELGKGQLTLMLGDRYAGRFPIITEPGAASREGQWTLEQKLVNPAADASGVVSASYNAPAAPVDRTLVLRSESPQASGATISITSGPAPPSGPTAVAPAAIRLSPQDAEELADILSVGSRVTIRR